VRLRERLLDLFFPPRCGVCGEVLASGEVFCPACREELLRTRTPRDLRGRGFRFSDCVFAADYDDRTIPAILNLKRIPESAEAEVFADMLAQALRERCPEGTFAAAVPVPILAERRRRRGFNQAETLARALCRRIGTPLRTDLLRAEDGAQQHTLSYPQRLANVRRIYRAAPGASADGRVLLIDDVFTTGATLDRCAQLLRGIGAGEVVAAAAVSVPHRKEPSAPERS